MELIETKLAGCFVIKHDIYRDERGYFQEIYNKKSFERLVGSEVHFEQDNFSVSKKGVLRGLHFQKGPHAQAKLVHVFSGEVLDVVVDLRKESKTFGQHLKIRIKDKDGIAIFIPKGMAHGFLSLTDEVLFHYKCSALYNKQAEGGIMYNDPDLAIDWEYPPTKIILSEKDSQLPSFRYHQHEESFSDGS